MPKKRHATIERRRCQFAPAQGDGYGAVRIPRRWQSRTLRRGAAALRFGARHCADAFESPDDEAIAESSPSLNEPIDARSPSQTSAPPWSGDFWSRSQLSGDWFGVAKQLAENGFTFFGDITQYYQGVTSGGGSSSFAYGGRGDYLIDIDSGKLGLWNGGHLDLRGETRLGQDCNEIDGAVALSNFAMALPRLNQNVTALTGVQFTQDLSERLSVFFGKLNILDGTPASVRQRSAPELLLERGNAIEPEPVLL